MKTPIPFVDLHAQYHSIKDEIDAAVATVLERCDFIMGKAVEEFETEFAEQIGARHAVAVSSGTDALNLAVKACGIKEGDEVITVSNTWISTAFAATRVGARVKFVDIDPDTHQIDVEEVSRAITDRTRAIIPVHLYGHPAPVDKLVELSAGRDIKIIEDAAQAPLTECGNRVVGSIGDIGCFSFYPSKNLGCYGDGGAVATNDDAIAENVRILRNYGQTEKFSHIDLGENARLDTIQAAVLRAKLPHLRNWTAQRRVLAGMYDEALEGLPINPVYEPSYGKSVYHLYVIEADDRDACVAHFRENGVMAQVHYPNPIHLQRCYDHLGYTMGSMPVTEKVMGRILSLPMFPELSAEQIVRVADVLRSFLRSRRN